MVPVSDLTPQTGGQGGGRAVTRDPRWVWLERGTLKLLWEWLEQHPKVQVLFPDEAAQSTAALSVIVHQHFERFPNQYDPAGLIYRAVRNLEQRDAEDKQRQVEEQADTFARGGFLTARRAVLAAIDQAKDLDELRSMVDAMEVPDPDGRT